MTTTCNPSIRGLVCRCGRAYTHKRLYRTLGLQGQVIIRNMDVYICGDIHNGGSVTKGCGDAWAVNLDVPQGVLS